MLKFSHHLDFPFNTLLALALVKILLLVDLQCNDHSCQFVLRQHHWGICPRAQIPTNLIISDLGVVSCLKLAFLRSFRQLLNLMKQFPLRGLVSRARRVFFIKVLIEFVPQLIWLGLGGRRNLFKTSSLLLNYKFKINYKRYWPKVLTKSEQVVPSFFGVLLSV